MKHTIKKLRTGDYLYRGHRITQSELISQQDNLTCRYDWEPMYHSRRGGYTGWYISVENNYDIAPHQEHPAVACKYEHGGTGYGRKDCMSLINNHIDKTDELEIKLGLSGKVLTGAEIDILDTARTEAKEKAETAERDSKAKKKRAEIYNAIFDTITADDMQGMAFCETTEALIETLKDKGLLHHEIYYGN